MSEKLKGVSPEQQAGAERLEESRAEVVAELERKLEKNAEKTTAENLENARHEALELAQEKEVEQAPAESSSKEVERPEKPIKRDLDASFNQTMTHIRKDMSPASRTFSKVIHNPVVDKTSEFVGNTVARPNLILAGAIGTLIIGTSIYLVAKNYGYVLSGFEAIGASVLGWAVGAIIEFARVGLKNKKS